jgi:hypothetical protein
MQTAPPVPRFFSPKPPFFRASPHFGGGVFYFGGKKPVNRGACAGSPAASRRWPAGRRSCGTPSGTPFAGGPSYFAPPLIPPRIRPVVPCTRGPLS